MNSIYRCVKDLFGVLGFLEQSCAHSSVDSKCQTVAKASFKKTKNLTWGNVQTLNEDGYIVVQRLPNPGEHPLDVSFITLKDKGSKNNSVDNSQNWLDSTFLSEHQQNYS